MEYTSNKVSKISGVSARTLRYYDEIGLLKPARVASSRYRIYGQAELDTLQQILFYRELNFPLEEIKKLLSLPNFDREQAFMNHLAELSKKREQLDTLIETVTKSIAAMRGEQTMSDKEKFEGFKQSMIDENERQYGTEIREKYGDEAINITNARIKSMTFQRYAEGERLRQEAEHTQKLRSKPAILPESWRKKPVFFTVDGSPFFNPNIARHTIRAWVSCMSRTSDSRRTTIKLLSAVQNFCTMQLISIAHVKDKSGAVKSSLSVYRPHPAANTTWC